MTIKTVRIFPPIPIRSHDWCAYDSEADPELGPYGWGETEQGAIDDLKDQLPGGGEPCNSSPRS